MNVLRIDITKKKISQNNYNITIQINNIAPFDICNVKPILYQTNIASSGNFYLNGKLHNSNQFFLSSLSKKGSPGSCATISFTVQKRTRWFASIGVEVMCVRCSDFVYIYDMKSLTFL